LPLLPTFTSCHPSSSVAPCPFPQPDYPRFSTSLLQCPSLRFSVAFFIPPPPCTDHPAVSLPCLCLLPSCVFLSVILICPSVCLSPCYSCLFVILFHGPFLYSHSFSAYTDSPFQDFSSYSQFPLMSPPSSPSFLSLTHVSSSPFTSLYPLAMIFLSSILFLLPHCSLSVCMQMVGRLSGRQHAPCTKLGLYEKIVKYDNRG